MRVVTLSSVQHTGRAVSTKDWNSRRLLTARDGTGYSLHDTVVRAGAELRMHYRNHVEAVYVIEGEGELLDCAGGETHMLGPGTLYLLDEHDEHVLRAVTTLRAVCVFTPALTGTEVHDETGAYPASP
jgi:L-ectoine synthase